MPKYIPTFHGYTQGCDPEIFLARIVGRVRRRKSIVGSEVVVPEVGLIAESLGYGGKVTRDGVQVEINPKSSSCRQTLSGNISHTLKALKSQLDAHNDQRKDRIVVDFSQMVKPTKGDLLKMSPDCRRLNCLPSENVYGRAKVEKNGETYLFRSAGGHLHFGGDYFQHSTRQEYINPAHAVKTLDLFSGITGVLLDRNPLNAKRREVYGRAGEYRLPPHGLEYRTLSNFWLRHYVTVSMVFALARQGLTLAGLASIPKQYMTSFTRDGNYWLNADEMLATVDWAKVEKAINTNDWEMAKDLYERHLRPYFEQIHTNVGVEATNVRAMDFFIDAVRKAELAGASDPLQKWFPIDPWTYWTTQFSSNAGFETFLRTKIQPSVPAKFSGYVMYSPPAPPAPEPTVASQVAEAVLSGTPIVTTSDTTYTYPTSTTGGSSLG